MNVLAVLLAAGAGTRFPGPIHKLRHNFGGRPLLTYALDNMLSANIGPCAVVTGAIDLHDLIHDATELDNPDWATGQRSSVLAAIAHARTLEVEAIVIGLGDQPFLQPESWRAVAQSPATLAVATYEGQRGHPVRVHKSLWEAFESLQGDADEGLRTLMRLHSHDVREVACKGTSADIDTPEDSSQWTYIIPSP